MSDNGSRPADDVDAALKKLADEIKRVIDDSD